MRELVRLRDRYEEFEKAGVAIVAVTTQPADACRPRVERLRLPFPVVSDEDGLLLERTGLRHEGAGPDGSDLFYATAFLVDRGGVVRWRFAPTRLTERASPDEILRAAREALPLAGGAPK